MSLAQGGEGNSVLSSWLGVWGHLTRFSSQDLRGTMSVVHVGV